MGTTEAPAEFDLVSEGLISAKRAGEIIAIDGVPREPSVIWRWWRHGLLINGERLHLEGLLTGGRFVTSAAALSRFLHKVAAAHRAALEAKQTTAPVAPAVTRSDGKRSAAVARAEQLLSAKGFD